MGLEKKWPGSEIRALCKVFFDAYPLVGLRIKLVQSQRGIWFSKIIIVRGEEKDLGMLGA